MTSTTQESKPTLLEFVIIISLMMSLTALAIDAMLPALHQISQELGVVNPNDRQLVISLIFLGQGLGQLFFGPLSDNTGRKKAIFIGYAIFAIGSLFSIFSYSMPMMLIGRMFQGIGISAPRGVSMAIVRDRYEGSKMARVMSFAMTVFILVPTIAPTIGQGILSFAGWRSIFTFILLFAIISLTWFGIRMPETLASEDRVPFSFQRIAKAIKEIFRIRPAIGFTLASGLVYGVFNGYLNSSQQIFQDQYALGTLYPLFFAIISLSLGSASFLNARLVMRYGMEKLIKSAVKILFCLALAFLLVAFLFSGEPPLAVFMAFLILTFFCIGILFGNLNSMAMQPLGKLAGIGSGVVGSFSTLTSMLLGTIIGQSYNGTIIPLVAGMVILSGVTVFIVQWSASK